MLVQVSELAQRSMTYLGMPTPVSVVSNPGGGFYGWADVEFTKNGTTITPSAGAAAPFCLGRSP